MSVLCNIVRVLVTLVALAWSLVVLSALVALTWATVLDVRSRRRE